LIVKNTVHLPLWSFQGARDSSPNRRLRRFTRTRDGPVSQSSAAYVEQTSRSTSFLEAWVSDGNLCHRTSQAFHRGKSPGIPRKEVIQPQLPLRLPCYDFTPVTNPTFGGCLRRAVSTPTSGVAGFRGVTGGVYKARERIHRGVADPRLLATPPSWRRVSASNPNRDRFFGIRSPSRVCSPLYRPM
jgi:hypothetical protein